MKTVEIMENLFFIQRGYLNANHFVYRCEEPVLIDTAYIADFQTTEEVIRRLGVDITHTTSILSTHCHCDHIGGNKIIQDMSSCDISLHKIGKHFIDAQDDWSTWWRYYNQEASFFNCTKGLDDGDVFCVDFLQVGFGHCNIDSLSLDVCDGYQEGCSSCILWIFKYIGQRTRFRDRFSIGEHTFDMKP